MKRAQQHKYCNRVIMTVEIKEEGGIEKVMEMLRAVGFDPQIKEIRSLRDGSTVTGAT